MPKLIPASTCKLKRMAGYWVLWRQKAENWNAPGDYQWRIHLDRVVEKRGNELRTQTYAPVALQQAWLLDGSLPLGERWPQYDWGSYKPLPIGEAKAVLDGLGVTW